MKKLLFLFAITFVSFSAFCQSTPPPVTDSVVLNGSGSTDPDGSIVKYEWTQVSGNATAILNANNVKATVKFTIDGTYVYQLTVTDNQGATGSAQTTVTVLPANRRPIANIDIRSITIQLPK